MNVCVMLAAFGHICKVAHTPMLVKSCDHKEVYMCGQFTFFSTGWQNVPFLNSQCFVFSSKHLAKEFSSKRVDIVFMKITNSEG